MPRTPITLNRPSEQILRLLRNQQRAWSPVYEFLITTAGIGVAEQWIEALDCQRNLHHEISAHGGPATWGTADGWYLVGSAESERIADARHERASKHLLAFSRRAWEAAKADFYASPYYAIISQ